MQTDPSTQARAAGFVRANTLVQAPPLLPEISLHLASEVCPIWQLTEEELSRTGLPPPYWAFAWAGGQALARYLLDRPETVRGQAVLDLGSGSGLVAIAAAKAGAARTAAADIDPFAVAAIRLNAALNGAAMDLLQEDLIGGPREWDVVLVGDLFYEQPLAGRLEPWLRTLARQGTTVLVGDPRRAYLPKQGLTPLATYAVATTKELEDSDLRNTTVWQLRT